VHCVQRPGNLFGATPIRETGKRHFSRLGRVHKEKIEIQTPIFKKICKETVFREVKTNLRETIKEQIKLSTR
jgi:hypothetical protein